MYFRKKLDFILTHLNWFFYLVFVILSIILWVPFRAVISGFITSLSYEVSDFLLNVIAGILTTVLTGGATWLFSKLRFGKRWALIIKVKIYRHLLNKYELHKGRLHQFIIPNIIRIFHRNKVFIVPEQRIIVQTLLDFLMNYKNHDQKIFWITGEAYSGKTTTILFLLIELITVFRYEQVYQILDRKIKYFDLARIDAHVDAVFQIKPDDMRDCLVIIDNFHRLPSEMCLAYAEHFVKWTTLATIVLTREAHEFLDQDTQITKFEDFIKQYGIRLNLRKLDIRNSGMKNSDIARLSSLYGLNPFLENASIAFHLAGLVNQNTNSNTEFNFTKIFSRFFNGQAYGEKYANFFIAIISTSLFSGSFSISEVKRIFIDDKWDWHIRMFLSSGFIKPSPDIDKEFYLFHETLSKYYMIQTYNIYIEEYKYIFSKLNELNKNNLQVHYLYSRLLLINDKNKMKYDLLFLKSNHMILLEQLIFIGRLEPSAHSQFCREYGILYDRVGHLKKAVDAYSEYLYQGNFRADAIMKLLQVDHTMYENYSGEFPALMMDGNPYVRLLSRYWKLHLEMHNGTFSFVEFAEIMHEWEEFAEQILATYPYDGIHLLKRSYFDYFRVYYMQGILDYKCLRLLSSQKLSSLLFQLPEFDAYYNKFVYGHYLHYDLMYKFGIFQEFATTDELNIIFGDKGNLIASSRQMEEIMHLANSYYTEAYTFMEKAGDKTAIFVRCRFMEVLGALGDYDKAIVFYKEFYMFAKEEGVNFYMGCAELYIAKILMIKRFDVTQIDGMNIELLNIEILDLLNSAEKNFYTDSKINIYTDVHISLYRMLLLYVIEAPVNPKLAKRKFVVRFKELEKNAHEKNYYRMKKLMMYINNNGYYLSFSMISNIVRFYPYVSQ